MNVRDKMLPVLRPHGGEEEAEALKEVIYSGWWGKGKLVEQFEEKFAEMVGSKYAVAVTSNTHGQDLIYKAYRIHDCDVISPTISFMTTGIVPLWNNCRSLLVDCETDTLNIDPLDVNRRLTGNTGAIMVVNMAGVPANIDVIRIMYPDGLIIEDCAHSCYVKGAGKKGDVAVWSFQAVKTLPAGDGGMITTDEKWLYDKLKPMTWLGIKQHTWDRIGKKGYSWDYEVDSLGYKAYMIDLTAAICLEQLKKLPVNLARRRHIQYCYNEKLDGVLDSPAWSETIQYYCARVPDPVDRDGLIDYLSEKNIHTSVHFKPLHHHPILKQDWMFPKMEFEWPKLISLPCHAAMTDEDIEYVVYWTKKYFEEKK